MDQPILATGRFRATWRTLDAKQKEAVIDLILALPSFLAKPHQHSGFGFRRLHGSDFWEARLNRRGRLILRIRPEEIILFDMMNHDQVRRL